jgi:hypothetical protein
MAPLIMLPPVQLLSTTDMTESLMLQGLKAVTQATDDEPVANLLLLKSIQLPARTMTEDESMAKAYPPPDVIMLVCRMFHTLLFCTVTGEETKKGYQPLDAVMFVSRIIHTLLFWTVTEEEMKKPIPLPDLMLACKMFHTLLV